MPQQHLASLLLSGSCTATLESVMTDTVCLQRTPVHRMSPDLAHVSSTVVGHAAAREVL